MKFHIHSLLMLGTLCTLLFGGCSKSSSKTVQNELQNLIVQNSQVDNPSQTIFLAQNQYYGLEGSYKDSKQLIGLSPSSFPEIKSRASDTILIRYPSEIQYQVLADLLDSLAAHGCKRLVLETLAEAEYQVIKEQILGG